MIFPRKLILIGLQVERARFFHNYAQLWLFVEAFLPKPFRRGWDTFGGSLVNKNDNLQEKIFFNVKACFFKCHSLLFIQTIHKAYNSFTTGTAAAVAVIHLSTAIRHPFLFV